MIDEIRKKLDVNKDGKIDVQEVFSKNTITIILGVLATIVINGILAYIEFGLAGNPWSELTFMDSIKQLIAPIILLFIFRSIISKADNEKTQLREDNTKKEQTLQKQRLDIQAKEGIINTKQEFINLVWNFIPEEIREKIQKID